MSEKLKSGIFGFIDADALGVPLEFLPREVLQNNKVKEMIEYGSHQVPEGTWCEDTSLMIAIMDSIIEKSALDYDDIMYKFSEWVNFAKYS